MNFSTLGKLFSNYVSPPAKGAKGRIETLITDFSRTADAKRIIFSLFHIWKEVNIFKKTFSFNIFVTTNEIHRQSCLETNFKPEKVQDFNCQLTF